MVKQLSPKAQLRLKRKKKEIAKNLKRRLRNKAIRTRMKNAVKAVKYLLRELESAHTKEERKKELLDQISEKLRLAVKTIDMASSKGVIHKNESVRRKARLMKLLIKGIATVNK